MIIKFTPITIRILRRPCNILRSHWCQPREKRIVSHNEIIEDHSISGFGSSYYETHAFASIRELSLYTYPWSISRISNNIADVCTPRVHPAWASSIKSEARNRLSISKLQYRTTPVHPALLHLSRHSRRPSPFTLRASHFSPSRRGTELSLSRARMNGRHFAAMSAVPELKRERDAERRFEEGWRTDGWRRGTEKARKREEEKERERDVDQGERGEGDLNAKFRTEPPPISSLSLLSLLSSLATLSASFTSFDICTRVYVGEPVIPARGKSFTWTTLPDRGDESAGGNREMEGNEIERER